MLFVHMLRRAASRRRLHGRQQKRDEDADDAEQHHRQAGGQCRDKNPNRRAFLGTRSLRIRSLISHLAAFGLMMGETRVQTVTPRS